MFTVAHHRHPIIDGSRTHAREAGVESGTPAFGKQLAPVLFFRENQTDSNSSQALGSELDEKGAIKPKVLN
jgi:hypothetical protein